MTKPYVRLKPAVEAMDLKWSKRVVASTQVFTICGWSVVHLWQKRGLIANLISDTLVVILCIVSCLLTPLATLSNWHWHWQWTKLERRDWSTWERWSPALTWECWSPPPPSWRRAPAPASWHWWPTQSFAARPSLSTPRSTAAGGQTSS